MSDSSRISGETFATERLRNDPLLTFEALRQAADQAGVTIQPIQYGRARRQLGLTGTPPVALRTGASRPIASPEVIPSRDASPYAPAPATPMPAGANAPEPTAAAGQPTEAIPTPAPPPMPAASNATPKRKGSPAFDFLVESLRAEPTLSYGELLTRATSKDYKIAPIMYGRAKALLGLVPVAPRGQGKNHKTNKLTPQQTLKQADTASADQFSQQLSSVRNVDDLVQIIKHLDSERRRLRGLLETIANSIDEALDHNDEATK